MDVWWPFQWIASFFETIVVIAAILAIGALIATGSFRLLYWFISKIAGPFIERRPCEVIPIRPDDQTIEDEKAV